ncbi:MAG: hypothetical protein JRM87_04925, partial [Nitrososphaerota archaeon]|nr:hypothetical protein [Nitrososphaerota archaeon]
IVKNFAKILNRMYVEYFASLPYYTEHFSTHIRNVTWFSYKIMQLNRTPFTELDVLLITLAAMIHDLGQFDPEIPHGSDLARKDPRYLIKVYLQILQSWNSCNDCWDKNKQQYGYIFGKYKSKDSYQIENIDYSKINDITKLNNKIKQIFNSTKLTKFAKLILAIAMYHPKDMVFDKGYRQKRMKKLDKSVFVEKIVSLEDILKLIIPKENEDIEHYKLLASILQLADAMDAWKYRDVSLDVYVQKLRGMMASRPDEKNVKNELNAWIKDLLIDKVGIESKDEENYIIFRLDKEIKWDTSALKQESDDKNIKEDKSDVHKFYKNIVKEVGITVKKEMDKYNFLIEPGSPGIKENEIKTRKYFCGLLKKEIIDNTSAELELVKEYLDDNDIKISGIKVFCAENEIDINNCMQIECGQNS